MSQEIADTDARLKNLLASTVEEQIHTQFDQKITEKVDDSKCLEGEAIKYYPYLGRAEVKLKNTNQKVIARLPHRYMGDLIDFFIPSGSRGYCETMKEPCIIPRAPLLCLLLKIKGNPEYFLVDYYLESELVGISPPAPGNVRVSCITGTNENYIEFGLNGFNVVSHKKLNQKIGDFEDHLEDVSYASADNVYTKEEVYTKSEVDELIKKAIEEALEEQ